MGKSIVSRGLGDASDPHGPCFDWQRKRGGSSPYYQFGTQRRYPYAWHGGPGGVPTSRVAAESRGMGDVPTKTGMIIGGTVFVGLFLVLPVVATVMIARSIRKSDRRGRR